MFDYNKMIENTKRTPEWLHFGAGNLFRGFIAPIQQNLLEKKLSNTGIVVAEAFDYEIIDKVYKPYNNEVTCITLKADGTTKNEKIKSIAYAIKASIKSKELEKIFESKDLQMISFTITEKGYTFTNKLDESIMSIVTYMMYKRFLKGAYSVALVSMDNCSNNGDKLKNAIISNAESFYKENIVTSEFLNYLKDEKKVTFPLSMIDKITPRPDERLAKKLNMPIIITEKKTYIAPFVNTEEAQYLVIEDKFPAKRPKLENAGVFMTDRNTVKDVERMKVTTCLNPLHTALAIYGCLLGFNSISDEMNDRDLKEFVLNIAYKEGMPVVTNPKIISPEQFVDEVINKRLPNAFIPDTPQRIACDTSMKLAIRYGETIKSYVKDEKLDTDVLVYIPLVLAGWFRYLLGKNDNLEEFELSPDPKLNELCKILKDIEIGNVSSYKGQLSSVMKDIEIFGVDLYEIGLAGKVEKMFIELIQEKGSVRKTLRKYLNL